ncbi:hypothetical protein KQI30_15225 [Clostridium bornimense]|uniref:hypothetical protein n=1 Tax=Clostridium bornimense TaxID=1216932 RepID=UPI001C12404C|nr:hypothetical protein [Clostridium bornimense]MBU5317602.1 hypothetical protein [Clostridium bornimense]
MKAIAKTVEMVAWFDNKGKINPVKFKVEEDDDSKVIKINKILRRDFERLADNPMWKFTCSSIIDGIESSYNLKYDLMTCRWLLFLQ